MNPIISTIVTTVCLFILGIICRKSQILEEKDAETLIKIAFYVALPALIIKTIPNVKITIEYIILPMIACITILLSLIVSKSCVKFFHLPKESEGVFIIGTMILNLGFNIPFVLSAYGEEGFARASFLDIGNIFLTLSLTYYIAQTHNKSYTKKSIRISLLNKNLITSPPLIALIISIGLNIIKFELNYFIIDVLNSISAILVPLLMISIGLYFSPSSENLAPALSVVLIRMGLGLIIGITFISFLNFDVLTNKIIILSTAAPVGFNTLAFATLEDLDKKLAANTLSLAIPLGIISNSIIILCL